MLPRVNYVTALGGFRLRLGFTDGSRAEIDLGPLILKRDGVFLALRDPAIFSQVTVDSDAGTLVWPNGADIDPDVLYGAAHATDSVSVSTSRVE